MNFNAVAAALINEKFKGISCKYLQGVRLKCLPACFNKKAYQKLLLVPASFNGGVVLVFAKDLAILVVTGRTQQFQSPASNKFERLTHLLSLRQLFHYRLLRSSQGILLCISQSFYTLSTDISYCLELLTSAIPIIIREYQEGIEILEQSETPRLLHKCEDTNAEILMRELAAYNTPNQYPKVSIQTSHEELGSVEFDTGISLGKEALTFLNTCNSLDMFGRYLLRDGRVYYVCDYVSLPSSPLTASTVKCLLARLPHVQKFLEAAAFLPVEGPEFAAIEYELRLFPDEFEIAEERTNFKVVSFPLRDIDRVIENDFIQRLSSNSLLKTIFQLQNVVQSSSSVSYLAPTLKMATPITLARGDTEYSQVIALLEALSEVGLSADPSEFKVFDSRLLFSYSKPLHKALSKIQCDKLPRRVIQKFMKQLIFEDKAKLPLLLSPKVFTDSKLGTIAVSLVQEEGFDRYRYLLRPIRSRRRVPCFGVTCKGEKQYVVLQRFETTVSQLLEIRSVSASTKEQWVQQVFEYIHSSVPNVTHMLALDSLFVSQASDILVNPLVSSQQTRASSYKRVHSFRAMLHSVGDLLHCMFCEEGSSGLTLLTPESPIVDPHIELAYPKLVHLVRSLWDLEINVKISRINIR